MRVHVRGQLGTQLLQAFVGIGRLAVDEVPTIVVNSGGGVVGAKTSQLHWVTDPQCDVREDTDGVRKTPYWYPGAGSIAFREREKTLRWLPLIDRSDLKPTSRRRSTAAPVATNKVIVHVRSGDKNFATVDSYNRLLEYVKQQHPFDDIVMVGNPDGFMSELQATNASGSATEDWFAVLEASHVYCGPTAFVGSTLLYDPTKKVSVMGRKWCDGTYLSVEDDLRFFEEAKEFCPNLEILP